MARLYLGEGTYGKVYKIIREGKVLALKEFKNEGDNYLSEVSLGMQCDHPNIVKVVDFGQDHLLMQAGTHDLHQEVSREMPSEEKILSWLPAMFSSLIYLHENGIAHGDVKDSNFVFLKDGSLLLCDLGSCSLLEGYSSNLGTLPSPQVYVQSLHPDEVKVSLDIFQEKLNKRASDAWSLGATLLKLLTGKYPFLSRDPLTEYTKYNENPLAYLFAQRVPVSFVPLLQVLLSSTQKKRNDLRRVAERFSIPIVEGRKPIFSDFLKVEQQTHPRIEEETSYSPLLSQAASIIYTKVKSENLASALDEDLAQACLFLASHVYDSGTLAEELEESSNLAFTIFRQLKGQLYFELSNK
nr:cyclin-dependent kinase [Cedratvirus plubellavi]